MKTVAYVFTDIPFSESHSPYFFIKNGLKLLNERALEMIPKCGRVESLVEESSSYLLGCFYEIHLKFLTSHIYVYLGNCELWLFGKGPLILSHQQAKFRSHRLVKVEI